KMLRDVRRRPLWVEREGFKPPRDGRDVRLSIDTVVQAIAERELAAACEEYQAKRGEVVVMDSRTGQLLAMANWPPMSPQEFPGADAYIRRNRTITDAYEPGSVFKPFLHAVATQRGLARPEQIIDTGTGLWFSSRGRRLRDAHPHGEVTWDDVLVVSSNIGMAKVLEPMTAQQMHDAVQQFGFGLKPGTGLPGESPGLLNPARNWTHYSLSSVPMGHEIGVTGLQLAQALSVFANEGMMVAPSVMADDANMPIFRKVLDADVAQHTRMVMRRVVTEGTGRRVNSEIYRLWGKTGTAQMARTDGGGYAPGKYTASFICGAPLLDPKIIVVVSVHEPDPSIGYYGGIVAAPVAQAVVEQTLGYLGVPSDVEDHTAPSHVVQAGEIRD
ncbi:MAG: penicillin-binding protein 2, partial [Phycisphaeraceae bacterium]